MVSHVASPLPSLSQLNESVLKTNCSGEGDDSVHSFKLYLFCPKDPNQARFGNQADLDNVRNDACVEVGRRHVDAGCDYPTVDRIVYVPKDSNGVGLAFKNGDVVGGYRGTAEEGFYGDDKLEHAIGHGNITSITARDEFVMEGEKFTPKVSPIILTFKLEKVGTSTMDNRSEWYYQLMVDHVEHLVNGRKLKYTPPKLFKLVPGDSVTTLTITYDKHKRPYANTADHPPP